MSPVLMFVCALLLGAAALALAVVLLLALCALVAAVCAWAYVGVASWRYERLLAARYEPLPPSRKLGHRHACPQLDPAAVDADEYWTAAREASAMAELSPTLLMPPLDLSEVRIGEYGGAR